MSKKVKRFNIADIKTVATRLCIAVLIFFFLSIVLRVSVRNIVVEKLGIRNTFTDRILAENSARDPASSETANNLSGESEEAKTRVAVDWEALYPFDSDQSSSEENRKSGEPGRLESAVSHVKEFLGLYTSDYLIGYDRLVQADNAVESACHWNIDLLSEYNPLVELEDGYFVSYVMPFDVSQNIETVSEFASYCRSEDMDFLYIQTPDKISKYEDTEIAGVLDYSNTLADRLVAGLDANGVDTLDLREDLAETGIPHRNFFFKTDHHWKPEAGLWATGVIAAALNARYGYDVNTDLFLAEQYDTVVYEEWFLGSSGKKVTLAKAEPENISLLYPRFQTALKISVPSLNLEKEGDFSVTYDMSCIEEKDYMRKNPYGTYCYSDEALIRITNKNYETGKKIVMVKCSYANVVSPFLSLGLRELDIVDLRYYKGSLRKLIREEQPDGVLVLYSPDFIGDVEHVTRMNPFDFD